MTSILLTPTDQIRYDPAAGVYSFEDGTQIRPEQISLLLNQERGLLKDRLQTYANGLTNDRLSLAEFETAFTQDLKSTFIQISAIAAGGISQLTPLHYRMISRYLSEQFNYLNGFVDAIASGILTRVQIIRRSGRYGASIVQMFFLAQTISAIARGHNEASRTLDPISDHCRQCPRYQTNGFTRIDQVIPKGNACDCGGFCRCRVTTRFNPNLGLVDPISLSDNLMRLIDNANQTRDRP